MAIAVRSVKAGMTTFGYLRSRLKDGAKLGCRGAAIGPPTRTPARSACIFRCLRRTKSDAKQHQQQSYEKLHRPIFISSVKTGMIKRGHPRSGLVGGAKPGCKAAAIEPPCSDASTRLM